MRHGVEDDIDTHGVGVLFRIFPEIFVIVAFPFPAINEIIIIA
jgi:hypothetical protein